MGLMEPRKGARPRGALVGVIAAGLMLAAPGVAGATDVPSGVSGSVAPALSLSLTAPGSFGTFLPGQPQQYTSTATGTVVSTAGSAALSVADPAGGTGAGHLVNGAFTLAQPVAASAASPAGAAATGGAISGSPLTLLSYAGPVSNDTVTVTFKQPIGASDPLRTG